ncbi:MAG: hypothetical protein SXQ77_11765, partial [Halobacteria archaeon]|nr:hypothetical protein [Halobacteria archaeon]
SFERVVRETAWAVGHIAADWGLDAMGSPGANREVIDAVFDASATGYALLEADRPELREVIGIAESGKLEIDVETVGFDELHTILERLENGEIEGRAVLDPTV